MIAKIQNMEITMCYTTADIMLDSYSKKYKKDIVSTSDPKDISMSANMVIGVELSIETTNKYSLRDKTKLIKKYNIDMTEGFSKFTFKKDKLRIFLHAFNIFVFDNQVLLAQSWQGIQEYHIVSILPNVTEWLSSLHKSLNTSPIDMFGDLDPEYNDNTIKTIGNIKNILKMMDAESMELYREIRIKYINL